MPEKIPVEINQALNELAKSVRLCYQCGTCAAGCPVFRVRNDKNPRLLVERLLLGNQEEVIQSDVMWYCCNCYTCTEHCPQGVDLAHVMVNLKNLAVQMGYAPQSLIDEITAILTTGGTAELTGAIRKRREKIGLPAELKGPDVKEIETLLQSTGVISLIDQAKKKLEADA
ncbi:MAG: 4Fe-4S dicluster domain-containing protein [Promethearchaeota archaeon]